MSYFISISVIMISILYVLDNLILIFISSVPHCDILILNIYSFMFFILDIKCYFVVILRSFLSPLYIIFSCHFYFTGQTLPPRCWGHSHWRIHDRTTFWWDFELLSLFPSKFLFAYTLSFYFFFLLFFSILSISSDCHVEVIWLLLLHFLFPYIFLFLLLILFLLLLLFLYLPWLLCFLFIRTFLFEFIKFPLLMTLLH